MRKSKKQADQTPVQEQEATAVSVPATEEPAVPPRRSSYERKESQDAESARRRQEEEALDIINAFIQASKSGATLESEISGVLVSESDNDVYWQCIHGPMTVRIPFAETFDALPQGLLDASQPHVLTRRRQFLQKSIGLKIRFIVERFEPDPANRNKAIVYASRKKAMAKIRQSYFGKNAYRPVKKGDIFDAQLLSVGDHGAWLSFRGVDVPVRPSDLTHRYLPSMAKVYATGQKVKIMVTDVSEDPKTGSPVVKVSGRPIELEESKSRRYLAPKGSVYAATITAKNKRIKDGSPIISISLWLENVDIPAFSSTQAVIDEKFVSGDKVYVEVLGFADSGYAHCKILRRAGNSI